MKAHVAPQKKEFCGEQDNNDFKIFKADKQTGSSIRSAGNTPADKCQQKPV